MSTQLQPGTIFGSYQLVSPLGEGSFGEVHLAVHRILRRRVALKVLRSDVEIDDQAREDFLREAQIIASFHHPRIVEVYDAGEIGGRLFHALRYFPAGTAEELTRKAQGHLPERQTLELIRDIAQGLRAIEELGMVHRDIKPSNILIDDQGRGTITDLGTALIKPDLDQGECPASSSSSGGSGILVGTPAYLAPELCLQEAEASILTDLYALGATMYYFLVGQPPYAARHLMQLLYRVATEPFPDVRLLRPDLQPGTVALLERLTARTIADRFQNADEVLHAVSALIGEPHLPYLPPVGRSSIQEVCRLAEQLEHHPVLAMLLDAFPTPSLVLNQKRQIIAANSLARRFLGVEDPSDLIGKRPGEAFGCVEVPKGTDGCGTTPNCRLCGLGQVTSDATQGCPLPMERTCHITTDHRTGHDVIDVQARLSPLKLTDEPLYLLAMTDITESLQRRLLEKVFLNDLLKTADSVRELSTEISDRLHLRGMDLEFLSTRLIHSTEDLVDQLIYQHQAIAAESGDLLPILETTDAVELIEGVDDWVSIHPSPGEIEFHIRPGKPYRLHIDTMLFRRVLCLLVEAEREWLPAGEIIELGYEAPQQGTMRFWIRHGVPLSTEERMQLFKREAPTASKRDRGPSTCLARLILEHYLHGHIRVESRHNSGTCYWLEVPTNLPEEETAPRVEKTVVNRPNRVTTAQGTRAVVL